MAKIVTAGKAIIIRSSFKTSDFETIGKYRPDSLILKDEDNNPIFAVKAADKGSVNCYGIAFDGTSQDGNAEVTIVTSDEVTVDFVSDCYGRTLLNLNKVEEKIPAVLAEIETEKAVIAANIETA